TSHPSTTLGNAPINRKPTTRTATGPNEGGGPGALHTDLGVLAQSGGGVVRDHRTPGPAPDRRRIGAVPELNKCIRAFVTGWNDRCHPFAWTNTSTEILNKTNRPTNSKTGL
ncbi:hypothetical protein AB0P22_13535, partial [Kocuria marina]